MKRKDAFERYLERSEISLPVLKPKDLKGARRKHEQDKARSEQATQAELEAKWIELRRMHSAWKGRNVFGVFDATIYCDEAPRVAVPAWVLHFWARELISSLEARRPGAPKARGRFGRHAKATVGYAEALRDRVRYETVEDCRAHANQIERVRVRDIYEQARILLENTPVAGSKKTMERVYKKIEHAIRDTSSQNTTSVGIPAASSRSCIRVWS